MPIGTETQQIIGLAKFVTCSNQQIWCHRRLYGTCIEGVVKRHNPDPRSARQRLSTKASWSPLCCFKDETLTKSVTANVAGVKNYNDKPTTGDVIEVSRDHRTNVPSFMLSGVVGRRQGFLRRDPVGRLDGRLRAAHQANERPST